MFKHLTFAQKLLLSYAALLLCALILTTAFIFPASLRDRRAALEDEISTVAMVVSGEPSVVAGLQARGFPENLVRRFDDIVNASDSIGYLVIADAAGVRLYHPDHALIGGHFSGGDEAPILRGDAPYISERRGTSEEQLRAFHSVCDERGALLGFVMVSQSMRSIHNLQRTMFLHFSAICLAVLAIGMLLAYAISVNMRRILLGNEPPTFARMFLQREDILNHLSEGILAFDEFRNAAYKNSAGATFYPEASLPVEHPLFDCYAACKTSGVAQSAEMVNLDGKSYLVSAVPVEREGLFHIVMMILRDRTEIARLTEQVTGTNHIVDALRANTHEFMNKPTSFLDCSKSERPRRPLATSATPPATSRTATRW